MDSLKCQLRKWFEALEEDIRQRVCGSSRLRAEVSSLVFEYVLAGQQEADGLGPGICLVTTSRRFWEKRPYRRRATYSSWSCSG